MKKKKNKTIINILIVFTFSLAIVFMYLSLMGYLDKREAQKQAEQLQNLYYNSNVPVSSFEVPLESESETPIPSNTPTTTPTPTNEVVESNTPTQTPIESKKPEIVVTEGPTVNENFLNLLAINNDVVGWIKVNGTHIDYPVLLGDDNDYYLHRDIYEKETRSASIFMDFRNNVVNLSKNTIIYGHNLDDATMFSELANYVDHNVRYEFIKDYDIIEFNSIYKNMKFQIFSAYVEEVEGFQYLKTAFKSDEDFLDYVDTVKGMSLINNNVSVSKDDKIITLSTCNHWFLDSRTVVHAKLITD